MIISSHLTMLSLALRIRNCDRIVPCKANYETNCDAVYSDNINTVYQVDTTDNWKWHLSTVHNYVLASPNEILFPSVLQLGY